MRHENPVTLQSTYLEFAGASTPDVAPSGRARLWFDQANTQLKFSLNGGAYSNAPSGAAAPPASATTASLLLDSGSGGTAFAGSAAGTVLGINLGTGTSDLINAQKAGVARFSVSETGIMTTLKGIIGGASELANLSVFTGAVGAKGIAVQALALQTANVFEAQDSGAVARVKLGSLTAVADSTLAVRAIPSQTGMLLQFQDNATGAAMAGFSVLGAYVNSGGSGIISGSTGNQIAQVGNGMKVDAKSATVPAFIAKVSTSHTGTLAEFHDIGNVARVIIGSLTAVASTTLTLRQITSQTGPLLALLDAAGTTTLSKFGPNGRLYAAVPNSAPTDGDIQNNGLTFYLDEAGVAVKARIRKSDGTYLTLTITNAANPTLA